VRWILFYFTDKGAKPQRGKPLTIPWFTLEARISSVCEANVFSTVKGKRDETILSLHPETLLL